MIREEGSYSRNFDEFRERKDSRDRFRLESGDRFADSLRILFATRGCLCSLDSRIIGLRNSRKRVKSPGNCYPYGTGSKQGPSCKGKIIKGVFAKNWNSYKGFASSMQEWFCTSTGNSPVCEAFTAIPILEILRSRLKQMLRSNTVKYTRYVHVRPRISPASACGMNELVRTRSRGEKWASERIQGVNLVHHAVASRSSLQFTATTAVTLRGLLSYRPYRTATRNRTGRSSQVPRRFHKRRARSSAAIKHRWRQIRCL